MASTREGDIVCPAATSELGHPHVQNRGTAAVDGVDAALQCRRHVVRVADLLAMRLVSLEFSVDSPTVAFAAPKRMGSPRIVAPS